MSPRGPLIRGFAYTAVGQPMVCARFQWQSIIEKCLKQGGRRRVENGETFLHNRKGVIVFEIYANIPEKAHD